MALIISSTTDDQAAVNAAAGIEEAPVEEQVEQQTQRPPKVPPEPEPDEEEEELPDDDEPPPPQPPKKGGFQRKIEKLQAKIELLERDRYMSARAQEPQPQPPARPANAEPRQEDFQDYDSYQAALIDHRVTQKLEQRERQLHEQRLQQQEQEQVQGWRNRVGAFKVEVADFDDVLEAVEHIKIPPPLQMAIIEDDLGPKLAYELARQPETFAKIAQLTPLAAIKALGEFKAGLTTAKGAPPRKAVSNAPEPIRPVANGASGTVSKPMDQLPLGDYIRARERQIKARRNT